MKITLHFLHNIQWNKCVEVTWLFSYMTHHLLVIFEGERIWRKKLIQNTSRKYRVCFTNMETTDTLNRGDWLWYIITMCYNIRCVHVAHWCRLCKWCLQWSLQYIVTHDYQKVSMFYSPIWTSISSKFSFKVSFKLITYDQYYNVV